MKKIIFIIIVSNLFFISCNKVRDSAGVNRKVIDEYAVIENPPLVIPPNFNLIPPEQMESKNIDDTDSELAKEILFGLDENEGQTKSENSLINIILEETRADEVENNIRDTFNEDFAGQKSSINDEDLFNSDKELDIAIEETKEKNKNTSSKEKKKKRFFFF